MSSKCALQNISLLVNLASIYLEAEGHDLASQTVASEESLHGVSQLHLFREHIPEQLVEQVPGVKQRHQHSG